MVNGGLIGQLDYYQNNDRLKHAEYDAYKVLFGNPVGISIWIPISVGKIGAKKSPSQLMNES